MQIKVKDELSIAELRQALFEKLHELEDDYAIRHARNATLYITPTNGFGDEIAPRNAAGNKVDKLYTDGPYKSAADEFKL
ncbi:MAG: hypothetical protein KME37_09530 [Candidatus Thiodiazotropha sp. (ex Codakia orbicularis)]|nr:hypothetical protein [Candidatus Thiodiazotropha sp. (ex Codakia orbicularis)]